MTRARSFGLLNWTWVPLAAVAAMIVGPLAIGQPPAAQSPTKSPTKQATAGEPSPETPAETPAPEKAAKKEFRGRLPAYYGRVVDQTQREKIYAIQREFAPKIDALKAQLAALVAERDEKIVSVLTQEQRETIEKLKAEAQAKRNQGRATKASSQ
jgi:hypothetical protein